MNKTQKQKQRKKQKLIKKIKNILKYGLLIFLSNAASVFLIRAASEDLIKGFCGNTVYELATFAGLYVGIKELKLEELLFTHIIASTAGYFTAQFISNLLFI